ncbi:MAG: hypothetical protein IIY07_06160, partial [Thermoguttaceae bacterium]|nr:hypothetical protein [Thermoguttaceae bacterium]
MVAATALSVALGASFVWAQSAPFESTGPSRPQTEPFGRARMQTTSRAQTTHYENAWTRQTPSRPGPRAFGARRFGRTFAPIYNGTPRAVPSTNVSNVASQTPFNEQVASNSVPPTQAGPTPVSPRRVAPSADAPTVGTTPTPGTPTVREA